MAKRKIFDILPPQAQAPVPEVTGLEIKIPKELLPVKKVPQKSKAAPKKIRLPFPKTPVLIGVALVLVVVLSLVFIKPKAEIVITPVRNDVTFQTEASVAISKGDIAGEWITSEKNLSQEFPATGQKAKTVKATGIIRVYNNYSTAEQILIINTRFISDAGKLFRTSKRVVVPGQHTVSGKLVAGEADVEVAAAEVGEEYNIGPATFSIPGFSGTPKYTAFYGKSSSAMSGGSEKAVLQITKADLANAQNVLKEQALSQAKADLDQSLSSKDYISFTEARSQQVLLATTSAKEGQEADKFTYQVQAKAQAMVFEKANLEAFVKAYLKSKIAAGKELQENTIVMNYSAKSFDAAAGKIVLSLDLAAKIYTPVDETSLKAVVMGKKDSEIREIVADWPEVENSRIRLWPFWSDRAPEEPGRVTILLNLD